VVQKHGKLKKQTKPNKKNIQNKKKLKKTLQDLTVLSTEFFRRRKTHIPSVINLSMKSPTEMLRR
jgi:chemotaxis methyl-accepting protein methylase